MNMDTQLDTAQDLPELDQAESNKESTEQPAAQKPKAKARSVKTAKAEASVHCYDTIVIGAGISGIAAAHKMQQEGYDDYIVLERAERVIIIRAAAAMCRQRCIRFHLRQAISGAIYLPSSQKS